MLINYVICIFKKEAKTAKAIIPLAENGDKNTKH